MMDRWNLALALPAIASLDLFWELPVARYCAALGAARSSVESPCADQPVVVGSWKVARWKMARWKMAP
jgi:hypothetical protein